MNREEAQFILGAYRPNSEDAHDPQFQEALTLARQDPLLGQWFAEQQALDRAFAAKLRSRPIPSDLKARLLLARATGVCAPRWRQPAWIAAAACLALLFALAGSLLLRRGQATDFTEFRTAMANASLDMSDHYDVFGLDKAGLQRWLSENRGDPDFILPSRLADAAVSACKVFEWRQSHVTMLCFKIDGEHVDVFVINASDLPSFASGKSPAFFADSGLTTAAWRREGKVYLLAAAMPTPEIQKLL